MFGILGWGLMMSAQGTPCLEDGGAKQILAEMSPVLGYSGRLVVHGRIVREPVVFDRMNAIPYDDIRVDERKKGAVDIFLDEHRLGVLNIDKEGWVRHIYTQPIPSGSYTLRVLFKNCMIGTTSVRVLDSSSAPVVVRSDVDMTYLFTDFHSISAMRKLLKLSAKERTTLQGMVNVYRMLRDKKGVNRPLSFISGSPVFFKRVLENKMELDGVVHDELVLKPFKRLLSSGTLNPIPLLKEQIGYKLKALMRLRQNIPPNSAEVLLGDDTESDPVVYALYTQLVRKELSEEELYIELKRHDVSRYWRRKIKKEFPLFLASLGENADVLVVYIHQTKESTESFDEWKEKAPLVFHREAEEIEKHLHTQVWMSQ